VRCPSWLRQESNTKKKKKNVKFTVFFLVFDNTRGFRVFKVSVLRGGGGGQCTSGAEDAEVPGYKCSSGGLIPE
jgi:hypothetical protein